MEDIFEIYDFTNVTDWERFTADIESTIHEWNLVNTSEHCNISTARRVVLSQITDWIVKSTDIRSYKDYTLKMTYYKAIVGEDSPEIAAEQNLSKSDSWDDFDNPPLETAPDLNFSPTMADYFRPYSTVACLDLYDFKQEFLNDNRHVLINYYGLREFLVVGYKDEKTKMIFRDESVQNMILSAFHVATLNTKCELPIFLQINEPKRNLYLGVCQNSDIRTIFEMVHLKRQPPGLDYLSNYLEMFKDKAFERHRVSMYPKAKVSFRLSYVLQEPFDRQWTQNLDQFYEDDVDRLKTMISKNQHYQLPFGAIEDPLQEFLLRCSYHGLWENMIVENENYCDYDPTSAAHWVVCAKFSPNFPCMMSECLNEYMKLTVCHKTVESFLSPAGRVSDLTVPLERLASNSDFSRLASSLSPTPFSSRRSNANMTKNKSQVEFLPLSEEIMNHIMPYLFPDVSITQPASTKLSWATDEELFEDIPGSSQPLIRSPGSVVKLESKIQRPEKIDDTGDKFLDNLLDSCFMQSKIAPRQSLITKLSLILCQLSNSMQNEMVFCQLWQEFVLELRYRFDQSIKIPAIESSTPDWNTCLLNQKIQMLNCCIEKKIARQQLRTEKSKSSPSSHSQTSSNVDDDLFFDCFEEQTSLKDSVILEATKIRPEGRLRPLDNTTRLINNQNEFIYVPVTQAANPGCSFEDFLRWYSPKDVTETVDSDGKISYELSSRMRVANNHWIESWNITSARPVYKQKRLFDDTKEAEKDLRKIMCEVEIITSDYRSLRNRFYSYAFDNQNSVKSSDEKIELPSVEQLDSFVWSLLENKGDPGRPIRIPGGARNPLGNVVAKMFAHDVRVVNADPKMKKKTTVDPSFPPWTSKEYALRMMCPRPLETSRDCAQYMYIFIDQNEFRCAGAFTDDIQYFT
uniref:Rab3 GTPase-activating protein catalytic subunit n=1 Tax=Romanomermis culicivorax TaxID=13658 RepID=A0A915L0C5_ROMCU